MISFLLTLADAFVVVVVALVVLVHLFPLAGLWPPELGSAGPCSNRQAERKHNHLALNLISLLFFLLLPPEYPCLPRHNLRWSVPSSR